jgi:hypothetical protein
MMPCWRNRSAKTTAATTTILIRPGRHEPTVRLVDEKSIQENVHIPDDNNNNNNNKNNNNHDHSNNHDPHHPTGPNLAIIIDPLTDAENGGVHDDNDVDDTPLKKI